MHVQAPRHLLAPNLHIAVCRLPRQELLLLAAAAFKELYMERGMCEPKYRSKNRSSRHCDKTYMLQTEMTERGLAYARMQLGLAGDAEEACARGSMAAAPADDEDAEGAKEGQLQPFLTGKGKPVPAGAQAARHGIDASTAAAIVRRAVASCVPRGPQRAQLEAAADALLEPLDSVAVFAHSGACLPGFKMRSAASPASWTRSYPSSFAVAQSSLLVPMQSAARRPAGAKQLVYVHTYAELAPRQLRAGADAHAQAVAAAAAQWQGPYAVVEVLADSKSVTITGLPAMNSKPPVPGIGRSDLFLLPLRGLLSQQIVVKPSDKGLLWFLRCS